MDLFGHNHDVVDWLVGDQESALAVVDKTTRGVLNHFAAGVDLGSFAILVGDYLHIEQTAHDASGEEDH